ncbi:MAG: TlpA family protein disulfide reductase [Flavobacteriales bacterium]|nr:TlpA family protein disulfide reductase [Flavobacteriales bacterium]
MKNYLIILAVALLWIGCSEPQQALPDSCETTVHLSGNIVNGNGGDLVLYGEHDFEMRATVSDSGKFVMYFNADGPGYYTFRYAGEYARIFLSPGDSLHFSLDPTQFDESLQFMGSSAGINNYLIGKYLLDEQMDIKRSYAARFQLDAGTYEELVDSMTQVRLDFLKRSELKHGLPEDFISEEQLAINYERGIALYEYEDAAAYYQDVEMVEMPDEYYAFTRDLQLENPGMLHNETYRRYADTHVNHLAHDRMDDGTYEGDLAFTNLKLDCITEVFTDQRLKDRLLHATMLDAVSFYGAQDLTEVLAHFTKCCKDPDCIAEITAEVDAWKQLWKGNPAPVFSYNDANGNAHSVADFKGKVVYVDVWASWCGPCRREIPYLKDLEHDYHGFDVAFVSVSIDEDADAWLRSVEENELGGTQLLADKAWKSDICTDYKIEGIPRFLLIDQDGNIVSADAPRPSSGSDLTDMIDALLGIEPASFASVE